MRDSLTQTVTYDQLIGWGAGDFLDPEHIRRLFQDRKVSAATLDMVLDVHRIIGACSSFWVVMREELISPALMHELSIALGRQLLDVMRKRNVYIDFRTPQLLDKKEQWLADEISLGEYRVALARAKDARSLVAELDPLACAAADVICHAGSENPIEAFCYTYRRAAEALPDQRYTASVIDLVKSKLHK
jgi:hypothetical protein